MHFVYSFISIAFWTFCVSARPQPADWGVLVDCPGKGEPVKPTPKGLCGKIDRVISEHDHPDPHQVYKFEQITDNIGCGRQSPNSGIDDYCSITKDDVIGVAKSVAFGLGAEAAGALVTAGYEVTNYWESGSSKGCTVGAGSRVCVFHRTAHTMYGVSAQDVDKTCCKVGDPYDTVITAPNEHQGHEFLCGKDEQCEHLGYSYWHNMEDENNGVTLSGGPQKWPQEWNDRKIDGLLPKLKEKKEDK